jgi:carbamoyl-phosphate synthase large subunit
VINKVQEGSPHVADAIQCGEVTMVINTPTDAHSQADSYYVRRNALDFQVPYFTTIAGAVAAVEGIVLLKDGELEVRALQEYQATTGRVT